MAQDPTNTLPQTTRNKSRNLILLAALLVPYLLCWPTLTHLFSQWVKWDQSLSHSLPTLAIIAYIIWKCDLTSGKHNPKWQGILLLTALACSSVIWFIFQINQIELLAAMTLIATACLFIATCFSWTTLRQLAPIFALLLFTVPIWPQLTPPLVAASSVVVGFLVNLIEIPAYIQGNQIQIPSGIIIIADGCSGLRYLIVGLLLGWTNCLLNQSPTRQYIATIITCVALALLANWARIFLLVIIGHESNMGSSLMTEHETFGWIVFSIFIFPALYFAPTVIADQPRALTAPKPKPLAATLMLAIGPLLYLLVNQSDTSYNPYTLDNLALPQLRGQASQTNIVETPNGTSLETKAVAVADAELSIDLITNTPAKGRKLVPYINSIYNKEQWLLESSNTELISDESFEQNVLVNSTTGERVLILFQYNVGKSTTHSYWNAKLLQLKATLLNEPYFALIVLQAPCKNDCKAEAPILTFAAEAWEQGRAK